MFVPLIVSSIVLFIAWLSGLTSKSDGRASVSQSSTIVSTPHSSTLASTSHSSKIVSTSHSAHIPSSSSVTTGHATIMTHRETPSGSLSELVTPALLENVVDFWFEHFEDEHDHIVPKPSHNKRWFMGGKALDDLCTHRYAPALEAIRKSGLTTGAELLAAAPPRGPLDWLGLVLLLDQMPRNIYRDARADVVFDYWDPIARHVAREAVALGIPDKSPEIRWRFAYRNWFYMPLMHSEAAADHDLAVEEFELFKKDVLYLAESREGTGESLEGEARKVVQKDVETAKQLAETYVSFERSHQVIIERFGRYPHRNKVLGREATAEEEEYLEKGGQTFG